MTRSYFRVPFTWAPSLLSESLEQASTVFDETNSNVPKMLKMVRYGKVFYFNKASLYSGETIDTKQLSLISRFFSEGGGTYVHRLQTALFLRLSLNKQRVKTEWYWIEWLIYVWGSRATYVKSARRPRCSVSKEHRLIFWKKKKLFGSLGKKWANHKPFQHKK